MDPKQESYKRCNGCGSHLQNSDPSGKGYFEKSDSLFCKRCFKLKNYSQIDEVNLQIIKDENDAYFTKVSMQLEREKFSKIIYVFDAFYFNINSIPKLSDEKVVVIINKVDILPKAFNEKRLLEFYYEMVSKVLKVEELFLVSAKKNWGMDELYKYLSSRKTKFYLVGHANVGKSSLINSFLKISGNDNNVLATSLPGTTLDQIEISYPSFKLVDLPGYFEKNHPWLNFDFDDVRKLVVQKEVKVYSYQLKENSKILLDSLASVTTSKHSEKIYYHFALPETMTLHRTNLNESYETLDKNLFQISKPLLENEKIIINFPNDGKRVEFYVLGIGYVMTYQKGQQLTLSVPKSSLTRLKKTLFSKDEN